MGNVEVMLLIVGGLVAVDRLFSLIRGTSSDYNNMRQEIRDLHQWHLPERSPGVKVWWQNDAEIIRQNELLTELIVSNKENSDQIRALIQVLSKQK